MCQVERSRKPSGSRSTCASQESESDWEFVGAGMSSSDGPNGVLDRGDELTHDEFPRRDHHRVQSHGGRRRNVDRSASNVSIHLSDFTRLRSRPGRQILECVGLTVNESRSVVTCRKRQKHTNAPSHTFHKKTRKGCRDPPLQQQRCRRTS